jgi:5-methylcytosine-specific restriction endonuclease McrA
MSKNCIFCPKTVVQDSVFCKRHRRINRIKAKRRAEKLAAKNLCVKCGLETPKSGKKTCFNCILAWKTSFKKKIEERKAKGLCIRCGRVKADKRLFQCLSCNREKARSRKSHGFFYRRAKYLAAATSRKHFTKSLVKAKELAAQLEEIWNKQNGICSLSGRKLNTENSEIDHIKPRSRGGKTEKKNLRFLHADVNQAKRSLTDSAFFKLCREVLGYSE